MNIKTVSNALIAYLADQSGLPVYGLAIPMHGQNLLIFSEPIGGDYIAVMPEDGKGDYGYVRMLSPEVSERAAAGREIVGSCNSQSILSLDCRFVVVRRCMGPAVDLAEYFRALIAAWGSRNLSPVIPKAYTEVSRTTFTPDTVILPELPPETTITNWDNGIKVAAVDFTLTFHLDGCNNPPASMPC